MSQYPTSPIFSSINLVSTQPTLVSRAQSGKVYKRKIDGHVWTFSAGYNRVTREEMMPVFAFAMLQEGRYGTFTVVPPDLAAPQGTALGTPLINGASQTGSSLEIDGCTASQSTFAKAGDVFTVDGDLKVYMMTEDIPADVSGNATLIFKPPLEKVPTDGAALTLVDVEFTMSFDGDSRKYNAEPPLLYNYEIDLIESI